MWDYSKTLQAKIKVRATAAIRYPGKYYIQYKSQQHVTEASSVDAFKTRLNMYLKDMGIYYYAMPAVTHNPSV